MERITLTYLSFSLWAIEEASLDMIDNTDFMDTDIPFEIPLPDQPYMPVSKNLFLYLGELDSV